ncbi:MAG: phage N-6-adenine-methyltransferase [Gammaproteobacteria bacterium]|nr:phage N-6-adenine-methyltransferase [Gammaproteobacteria bacterium]
MQPEDPKDRWRTPAWLFAFLSDRYGPFDVDLCADHDNALCRYYYTRDCSWLSDWADPRNSGPRGFCNPPYSDPGPHVEKLVYWAHQGFSSVAVLPTHTNQRWAGHAAVATERIEFVGRVNFGQDDGSGVKNGNRGGTQILYFRARDLGFTRTVWLKTREIMERWA